MRDVNRGNAYGVYPGAMHSRFEHSLGVMELATQAFDLLALRHQEILEAELKAVPELSDDTLIKARQIVRLMAMLHDVGHPAFSHAAESTIPGGDHEKLSIHIIANVLGEEIDTAFFKGATALLVRLMEKSEELTFLREFVATRWTWIGPITYAVILYTVVSITVFSIRGG